MVHQSQKRGLRLCSWGALLALVLALAACRLGYEPRIVDLDGSANDDGGRVDADTINDAGVDAVPPDANAACATSTCGDSLCCPEVGESNATCPIDCPSMATCATCTATCELSCIGGNCDLTASIGSCDYNIDCTTAVGCRVECDGGSNCDVDCISANDCEVRCRDAGTTCFTDCTGATDCSGPRCRDGATCLLDCTGAITCGYDDCEGGQTSCPGNLVACNRACPQTAWARPRARHTAQEAQAWRRPS